MKVKKTKKLSTKKSHTTVTYPVKRKHTADIITKVFDTVIKFKSLIPWFLIKEKGSIGITINNNKITFIKDEQFIMMQGSIAGKRGLDTDIDFNMAIYK